MALINCIECSNKISDLAESCTHCGAPVSLSIKTPCFECSTPLSTVEHICPNCGVDQKLNPLIDKPKEKISSSESNESKIHDKNKEENTIPKKVKTKETKDPEKQKTEQEKKITVQIEQPKSKYTFIKRFFLVVIILLGIIVIGFQFLSDHDKTEIYKNFGIENSDFVKSNGLSSYVQIDETVEKNLLGNKWNVGGSMWSTHPSAVIRTVTVRFYFSDGSEDISFNKKLNPDPIAPDLFLKKIAGHSHAQYERCEVINASE